MVLGILGALLLATSAWLLAAVKGPLMVRLSLALAPVVLGFVAWKSIESYRGWPSDGRPPNDSVLIASDVVEPVPGESKGAIYLWVLQEAGAGKLGPKLLTGTPKAFKLPYSRKLHEALEAARREGAKAGGAQVLVGKIEDRRGEIGSGAGVMIYKQAATRGGDKK